MNGRVGHVRSIEGTLADLRPVCSPETVIRPAMPSVDGDLGNYDRLYITVRKVVGFTLLVL